MSSCSRSSTGALGDDVEDLIKRVIGLPGDTIEIDNCEVYIDGRTIDEPYTGRCRD